MPDPLASLPPLPHVVYTYETHHWPDDVESGSILCSIQATLQGARNYAELDARRAMTPPKYGEWYTDHNNTIKRAALNDYGDQYALQIITMRPLLP